MREEACSQATLRIEGEALSGAVAEKIPGAERTSKLSRRAAQSYSTAMNANALYAQIRANIAFEHMVVAVLIAAATCGAVVFVLSLGETFLSARWAWSALFGAAYSAVVFSFVSFLIGFFSAVVVGLPLYIGLERLKIRRVWPYVGAGVIIELVAAGFVLKRLPLASDFLSLQNAPLLLPGVIAALVFGRRIKALWRAAEREAAQARPLGGSGLLQ